MRIVRTPRRRATIAPIWIAIHPAVLMRMSAAISAQVAIIRVPATVGPIGTGVTAAGALAVILMAAVAVVILVVAESGTAAVVAVNGVADVAVAIGAAAAAAEGSVRRTHAHSSGGR